MKDWKKTLLGVALAVSVFFNAWPGDKPEIVEDVEPWVDVAVAVLDVQPPAGDGPVISRIVRVYDGDTVYVDIDNWPSIVGENIGIRLNGIDTPEIRGTTPEVKAFAIIARDFLAETINTAGTVELQNISRGKYFRLLADVICDGRNVSEMLLERGYAKPYDGGTRPSWSASDFEN